MTRLVAGGIFLVVAAEVLALVVQANPLALPAGGLAAAVFVLAARRTLGEPWQRASAPPVTDDAAESLQRWKSRTETTIRWAASTRADWDRHLRPRLAREFLLATRQKDPSALQATGRIVFGDELWGWVDPSNISGAGRSEPGPGYDRLDEILRRLERL